ncbi:hypothetical protein, partial [Rhodococcus marinonascens]|uniref:hypothetical protein n=1 Tax=Rhodococcus marinonascens TaxID=38311 RepID=UPI000933211B
MRFGATSVIAALSAITLTTALAGAATAQDSVGLPGSIGGTTIAGDGSYDVGDGPDEVKPGIYLSPGLENSDCSWKRESPLIASTVAEREGKYPFRYASAVIIEPTESTFKTPRCAAWESVTPGPPSTGSFGSSGIMAEPSIPGDGLFHVGSGLFDTVKPGIYQNPGLEGQTCTLKRVGPNFVTERSLKAIPSKTVASAVIIERADFTFESTGCATWEWVAPVPHSTGSLGSS